MLSNSTLISIYTLFGVFLISIISLSIIKPKFLLHMRIDGTKKIQWDKLITYSSILSLIFSILILTSYDKIITLYDNKFIHNKNPFTK